MKTINDTALDLTGKTCRRGLFDSSVQRMRLHEAYYLDGIISNYERKTVISATLRITTETSSLSKLSSTHNRLHSKMRVTVQRTISQ